MSEVWYDYMYDYLFILSPGDYKGHYFYNVAVDGFGECDKSDSVFRHSIKVGYL